MQGMEDRMQGMEDHLKVIDSRLDKLESGTNALKAGQLKLSKELKRVSDRVEDTYQLALDAWGQSTENRNILNAL